MAVTEGPLFRRMLSDKGRTAISHYFVMDWVSIWKDIAGGLLLAGVLAVFVPKEVWQAFFLTSHPKLTTCWSPLVGPIVAVLLFVCSVEMYRLRRFVERGQQFRRCAGLHLRRFDRASDPEHLSEILRSAGQRVSVRHNVRFNGRSRAVIIAFAPHSGRCDHRYPRSIVIPAVSARSP